MRVTLVRILLILPIWWTISPWHVVAHAKPQPVSGYPHEDAFHSTAEIAHEVGDTAGLGRLAVPDPGGDAGCCAVGPCSGLVGAILQVAVFRGCTWPSPTLLRMPDIGRAPPTRPPISPRAS